MKTYRIFKKGMVKAIKIRKSSSEQFAIIYFAPKRSFEMIKPLIEVRKINVIEKCLGSEVEIGENFNL